MIKVGIGQDSHRIVDYADKTDDGKKNKPLVLGGLTLKEKYTLEGNSDSDVVFHAMTNAISGITGKPILGPIADKLCKKGIVNSAVYLEKALEDLADKGYALSHISISLECARPKILPLLSKMKWSIAKVTGLEEENIGITATTGEKLTAFGKGEGVQAFACATATRLPRKT